MSVAVTAAEKPLSMLTAVTSDEQLLSIVNGTESPFVTPSALDNPRALLKSPIVISTVATRSVAQRRNLLK